MSVRVGADEAARRMVKRFLATGRLVNPDYFVRVGEKPHETYLALREEACADGYSQIEADGTPGTAYVADAFGVVFDGFETVVVELEQARDTRTLKHPNNKVEVRKRALTREGRRLDEQIEVLRERNEATKEFKALGPRLYNDLEAGDGSRIAELRRRLVPAPLKT